MAPQRQQPPQRHPALTGTVETPETPQQPRGQFWDQLAAARTRAQVEELNKTVTRLGYDPNGQLCKAIAKRLTELR